MTTSTTVTTGASPPIRTMIMGILWTGMIMWWGIVHRIGGSMGRVLMRGTMSL